MIPLYVCVIDRCHREQIRVLSVYSVSVDVDLFVIKTIQKSMNRFRWDLPETSKEVDM